MCKRLFTVFLVMGAAAHAPPVAAQQNCAARDQVIEWLGDRYSERMSAAGLNGPNRLFELWSSDTTGSWTLLMTTPEGQSCVIASGTNWHSVPVMMIPMGQLG
ncbi:MAG: hypothetical protein AAGH83_03310 [Pseudomonadota bacterium]